MLTLPTFGALLLAGCAPDTKPADTADTVDTAEPDSGDSDSGDSDSGGSGDSDSGDTGATGRPWPDTTARIGILADQLPGGMTEGQVAWAAAHLVGTQKLTVPLSEPIRALNPDFLVLHYHLAIWQSAPGVTFIVDGYNWDNDYALVDGHESWFWHNEAGERVASLSDAKLLMNLADPEFRDYWVASFIDQVQAGQYDAVFADSASPSLLQWEAQDPPEPRLSGTGAADSPIEEWGGRTYVEIWEEWIADLDARLAAAGIPLIPNTSPFVTTWDPTDYSLTAGAFVEGFATRGWSEADWRASTNTLLALSAAGKILVLQNYLSGPGDDTARSYYLGNYLLVKGSRCYLDYFAASPMEWYPEWELDLGAPTMTAADVVDLAWQGVYRRDFDRGVVLVNPGGADVPVELGETLEVVALEGGGAVPASGELPGSLASHPAAEVTVPAGGAVFLMR